MRSIINSEDKAKVMYARIWNNDKIRRQRLSSGTEGKRRIARSRN